MCAQQDVPRMIRTELVTVGAMPLGKHGQLGMASTEKLTQTFSPSLRPLTTKDLLDRKPTMNHVTSRAI
jgi:hypothetical protein